ncbi:TVP38/TMEM64 family protein [Frateuria aurantia]
MKRLKAMLPLLLLLLAGGLLYASGTLDALRPSQLLAHQSEFRAQMAAHPWLCRSAYIGLLTLIVATGMPGNILVIMAGGFAFGIIHGTLWSSAGLTLGSLVLFLASRYAFGHGGRPPAAIARLRQGYERHPVSYTMFLRLVPVVPFGLVTACLAWLRCPLWLFLGTTWLGGTVMLVFECSIGAGLGQAVATHPGHGLQALLSAQVLWPTLGILALALIPLLIRRKRCPPPGR